jgi:hypothetical protein
MHLHEFVEHLGFESIKSRVGTDNGLTVAFMSPFPIVRRS